MEGRAAAPGAGTVLNALATGTGAAFGIDVETRATVRLDPDADGVSGAIEGVPDADTALIERCVGLVVERYGDGEGGRVRTESDVPLAAGLKSSSAAANATVLATAAALGVSVVDDVGAALGGPGEPDEPGASEAPGGPRDPDDPDDTTIGRLAACRLGVRAARDAGVTATGAFDDASASMVGGVTVTDNTADDLLARTTRDWDVLVWTPPERAYTADADVSRCEAVAPVAELVAELALDGRFGTAMTVNGFAFSAALGFPAEAAVEALPHAHGVSLSGTGPSVVAVGDRDRLAAARDRWDDRPGTTRLTAARADGARVIRRS